VKSSSFNSISIVTEVNINAIVSSVTIGPNSPKLNDIIIKEQKSYVGAIKNLYPIVDSRRNRILIFTGYNNSLFLISNSPSGSSASVTGAVAAKFNTTIVDGFVNYPSELLDCSGNLLYPNSSDHFCLRIRNGREVSRAVESIQHPVSGPCYVNSGDLYDFEDTADYAGLEKGIIPQIDVLWKFANHFGWPSPRSKEFLGNVKKCELLTFPQIKGAPDRPIREDIQQEILKLPVKWLE